MDAKESFEAKEASTPEEGKAYEARKRELDIRYHTSLIELRARERELAETPAHTLDKGRKQKLKQDL